MSPRVWTFAAALIFAAQTTLAQHALHCRDLDPEAPQDAYRAFECVSKLDDELQSAQQKISDLENKVSTLSGTIDTGLLSLNAQIESLSHQLANLNAIPAQGSHINTRAIIAYYSDKGKAACPDGWSPYEEAKDRFIVGAGDSYTRVGEAGGEETVTLTEPQMPSHNHQISTSHNAGRKIHDGLGGSSAEHGIDATFDTPSGSTEGVWGSLPRMISPAGNSLPHNNLPPYIALYYCQKD